MDDSRPDASMTWQDSMLNFTFRKLESCSIGPRIGQLLRGGRKAIETPHYVATTSRGVVPHISHDTLRKHTAVSSIYFGLEDFIEKQITHAPIFKTPAKDGESPLRKYLALQDDLLSVLGPRRVPAIPCPTHSTGSAISISTSVGFSQLGANDYHQAIQTLRPDVAITMADFITSQTASLKRIEKSADRTLAWLKDASEHIRVQQSSSSPGIFAAIPPVENVQQSLYLQDLAEEYRPLLSGLAVYSSKIVVDLPESLLDLPRICLSDPSSPHSVLNDIALGIDLICVPFITLASDHGIALTFDFPRPQVEMSVPQPLGIDLWLSAHEASLLPLSIGCECVTCTHHHRAYVHHLLQAKEMLAWTLLQLHNLATMDRFFEACRASISVETFEKDIKLFSRSYEAELPARTGLGPRIRGYQTKSIGRGQDKKSTKPWGKLDDAAHKIVEAESGIATPQGDSTDLEEQGFAEKIQGCGFRR